MSLVENTKKQIESYKKVIDGKKFTKEYRQTCQDAIDSLEAMLDAESKEVQLIEINRTLYFKVAAEGEYYESVLYPIYEAFLSGTTIYEGNKKLLTETVFRQITFSQGETYRIVNCIIGNIGKYVVLEFEMRLTHMEGVWNDY